MATGRQMTDAIMGSLDPVLVTDRATLTRYAEALRYFANVATTMGKVEMAASKNDRADYLLTLIRD